jgi:hypothetical protein
MPGVEGNPWAASINGSQNFTKDVKIDGLSVTSSVQGDQMEVGPSMEAVEEVRVQTSGAEAENASSAGGVEMFAIKSGTNTFHGSAFGYELLFEMLSQRYERGSTMVTSNLPFQEWAEVLGSERLTGALLDPLTHHVHILEMNRDRYRLKQSRRKHGSQTGV